MNEIVLKSEFEATVKNLSNEELSSQIKTVNESAKSQAAKIQAVKFLDFGLKVPAKSLEYISQKFTVPKSTVQTIAKSFSSRTGEQLDDKVFYHVPDQRLITFDQILGSHPLGAKYLISLNSGEDMQMSASEFKEISEVMKTAISAHSKHSKDVRLLQQFESSKKLFKSEVYLTLTRLKSKFLRNEELSRKTDEINAASHRIADMHQKFAKMIGE